MKTIKILTLIICVTLTLTGCKKEDDIPQITTGLLAYYTFDDGTADDKSGNNLHAILNNSPALISDTPSGKGKALHLNIDLEQFLNIP